MWTGTDVVPPSITNQQAEGAAKLFGRKVFVCDNYPVRLPEHQRVSTAHAATCVPARRGNRQRIRLLAWARKVSSTPPPAFTCAVPQALRGGSTRTARACS